MVTFSAINGNEELKSVTTLYEIKFTRFKVPLDGPESGDEYEENMKIGWTTIGLQKWQKMGTRHYQVTWTLMRKMNINITGEQTH